jgi:hypothetical protein
MYHNLLRGPVILSNDLFPSRCQMKQGILGYNTCIQVGTYTKDYQGIKIIQSVKEEPVIQLLGA